MMRAQPDSEAGRTEEVMEVLKAEYSTPINAQHGFYVQVKGQEKDLDGGEMLALAARTAGRNGWGRWPVRIGAPVSHGRYITVAFWFYSR
jgi:hypothetical protein